MKKTSFSGLIITASLLVSPVAASATTQPGADKNAAANSEKKICKPLPSSSSRLPQRVCLTEKEWKQVEADSQ